MIERVPVSQVNVGQWIDGWKKLRDDGWDIQLLTVSEKHGQFRNVVALIGMGCKP